MIALLIIFLVIIVFLAIFIGYNLTNLSTFWFFHTYTDVPVLVLVFVSFAAGIVVSILFMLIGKILKMNKAAQTEKAVESDTKESEKAKKLKAKIKFGRKNKEEKQKDSSVIDNSEYTDKSNNE